MTAFLASVASLDEVMSALSIGVDILDLKDPSKGALGAWPLAGISDAVTRVAGQVRVSATVGDLPLESGVIGTAVRQTAATGVDFVKVGFFLGPGLDAPVSDVGHCLAEMGETAQEIAKDDCALVAVFFADQAFDPSWIPQAAKAGFTGVMLDTAGKGSGGLRVHMDKKSLEGFINLARENGLFTGLAGSLRLADVPLLLDLGPDYLGFRGALCRGQERTATFDEVAAKEVKCQFDRGVLASGKFAPLGLAS